MVAGESTSVPVQVDNLANPLNTSVRSRKASSGFRMRVYSNAAPVAAGVQASIVTPLGM